MRVNQLHTPVGLKDVLPEEYDKKKVVIDRIEEMFRRYGYRGVESPMLEYIEVFSDAMDPQQMYKLFDRDGSALALRADMTPPIARIAATAYAAEEGPLRFCYFGNAFRENASYQGKLHEFTQAGVELMGPSSAEADGEVLTLAVQSLLACGLREMKIHVGQVEFFKGILQEAGLREEEAKSLQAAIARRDYVASESMVKSMEMPRSSKELFLALPRLVGGPKVLEEAAAMTQSPWAQKALADLRSLYEILSAYGMADYVNFDLGMVNKLHYYTGIIFRGYTYGTGYSLVDGGRYDNLVGRYGKNRASVGFGIRINGLLDALEHQNIPVAVPKTDTLVAYAPEARNSALAAASRFRSMGMEVEVGLVGSDPEANFDYAVRRGMKRLLYFMDASRIRATVFTEEGAFDLDTTLEQIMRNLEGVE